jgi:hypothetical protein
MRSWEAVTSAGLALVMAGLLGAGALGVPAAAQQAPVGAPAAGTLNYVEGQASMGGQAMSEKAVGSAQLLAGQTLATQNGRAELLLTPGVLVRLDNNSAVLMDNPGIPDTQVAVQGGRAMVEADQVLPANHIEVREGPATVRIIKPGLYDFDAAHGLVRVFDGRAEVTVAGATHTLQAGHQFDLNAPKLKAQGFDKKASEDAFYRWASLRSSYLAEANADAARGFAQGYYGGAGYAQGNYAPYYGYAAVGPYGDGPGWFWDPYWSAYTWLPWDGIFFNPFGFGFYSPGFAYAAPFYGYGFRGGFHNFGPGYRPTVVAHSGSTGQVAGSGVHGGGYNPGFGARSSGVASGGVRSGFSGGGGGFHGGGGGGGGRR